MKSRMWENCSYGSVRGRAGDCPVYSTEAPDSLRFKNERDNADRVSQLSADRMVSAKGDSIVE